MAKLNLGAPPGGLPTEGQYAFQIHAIEEKKSSKKDTMFAVVLKILGGEFAGETVRDWFMLEGKAAWSGKRKIEAFLDRELSDQDEIFAFDLQDKCAVGWLKRDTYTRDDGEVRNTVKMDGFAGPNDCGYRVIAEEELKALAVPVNATTPNGDQSNFDDIPGMDDRVIDF